MFESATQCVVQSRTIPIVDAAQITVDTCQPALANASMSSTESPPLKFYSAEINFVSMNSQELSKIQMILMS